MATAAITRLYTPEEYLALEREARFKSEYRNGVIIPMSGASPQHNEITLGLASQVLAQFRGGPCEVYMSDVRLRVSPTGIYTYPDVMAVCGPQFAEDDPDTLLNPSVIVEVLSKSTAAYDRGEKFDDYRSLPSLREYVLVAQDEVRVERFTRRGDAWEHTEIRHLGETLVLESIGCAVAVSEIYAGVRGAS